MIAEIIGKLGLRYPPSGQADLIAHAERIKLLAQDVADVPPQYLERAVAAHARESVFMPKAAELIGLARDYAKADRQGTNAGAMQLQGHCDRLNAMKLDWLWAVSGESPNRHITRVR